MRRHPRDRDVCLGDRRAGVIDRGDRIIGAVRQHRRERHILHARRRILEHTRCGVIAGEVGRRGEAAVRHAGIAERYRRRTEPGDRGVGGGIIDLAVRRHARDRDVRLGDRRGRVIDRRERVIGGIAQHRRERHILYASRRILEHARRGIIAGEVGCRRETAIRRAGIAQRHRRRTEPVDRGVGGGVVDLAVRRHARDRDVCLGDRRVRAGLAAARQRIVGRVGERGREAHRLIACRRIGKRTRHARKQRGVGHGRYTAVRRAGIAERHADRRIARVERGVGGGVIDLVIGRHARDRDIRLHDRGVDRVDRGDRIIGTVRQHRRQRDILYARRRILEHTRGGIIAGEVGRRGETAVRRAGIAQRYRRGTEPGNRGIGGGIVDLVVDRHPRNRDVRLRDRRVRAGLAAARQRVVGCVGERGREAHRLIACRRIGKRTRHARKQRGVGHGRYTAVRRAGIAERHADRRIARVERGVGGGVIDLVIGRHARDRDIRLHDRGVDRVDRGDRIIGTVRQHRRQRDILYARRRILEHTRGGIIAGEVGRRGETAVRRAGIAQRHGGAAMAGDRGIGGGIVIFVVDRHARDRDVRPGDRRAGIIDRGERVIGGIAQHRRQRDILHPRRRILEHARRGIIAGERGRGGETAVRRAGIAQRHRRGTEPRDRGIDGRVIDLVVRRHARDGDVRLADRRGGDIGAVDRRDGEIGAVRQRRRQRDILRAGGRVLEHARDGVAASEGRRRRRRTVQGCAIAQLDGGITQAGDRGVGGRVVDLARRGDIRDRHRRPRDIRRQPGEAAAARIPRDSECRAACGHIYIRDSNRHALVGSRGSIGKAANDPA